MIKYSPVRETLSASIKEEQIFDSIEDMKQYIFSLWSRIIAYVGIRKPLAPDEIVFGESTGFDVFTGYRNTRNVFIRNKAIGFFDEIV